MKPTAVRHFSAKGASVSYIARWRSSTRPVNRSSVCSNSSSTEPK